MESLLPVLGQETAPIQSLLIKPASALCNLDCSYCFYLDRTTDPYTGAAGRIMSEVTLERLVKSWMSYSYPNSTFAFQGGEPTLAGLKFFEKLVELQLRYGRDGQSVSNSLQTNGILIDERWCELFRKYHWLIGVSLDGPESLHDTYRVNKGGQGTWARVMQSINTMRKQRVEFNILCVLSQANVEKPKELYRFFKSAGLNNLQFIPLVEFDGAGQPLPFTITPEQYGRFLREMFDLWWPDRRKVRIRCFDNLAEAVSGVEPGSCTMRESCDSYCVVEYNGDVYPCDFFVEKNWRLGNIHTDSWSAIAARQLRGSFAQTKSIPHPACQSCEWNGICHAGCPKFRSAVRGNFADLDYFCPAYRTFFEHAAEPLRAEVERLYSPGGRQTICR